MPMKVPHKKNRERKRTFHRSLLEAGFEIDRVVNSHVGLSDKVRDYEHREEHCEIDCFAVVPGRLVPHAKPDNLTREFYRVNSYVIYVKKEYK